MHFLLLIYPPVQPDVLPEFSIIGGKFCCFSSFVRRNALECSSRRNLQVFFLFSFQYDV